MAALVGGILGGLAAPTSTFRAAIIVTAAATFVLSMPGLYDFARLVRKSVAHDEQLADHEDRIAARERPLWQLGLEDDENILRAKGVLPPADDS